MRDLVGFSLVRQWHIAYPSGKQQSVVARAFLEYLWDNVILADGVAPATAQIRGQAALVASRGDRL